LVYDIRNKRDAAHLADGIDPNLPDATLVSSVLDWVLAEFMRLYHNVTADAAQQLVSEIVTRAVPVVQDFNGFLKMLKPNLAVSDHCLVRFINATNKERSSQKLRNEFVHRCAQILGRH
jgi:hypothetical protein